MKKHYFYVSLILFLVGCKSPQSKSLLVVNVEKATWSNWTGGQPGVGGTNYTVVLTLPKKTENIEVKNLIIDGQSLTTEKPKKEENKLTIVAIENRSNTDETVSLNRRRPDFRSSPPETAFLLLIINGREQKVDIPNFIKENSN